MSNEIDTLMDLDPLELSTVNVDQVIAYHRQRRAEREAGKGKRATKDSGPKLQLTGLIEGMVKAAPKPAGVIVKRRI